MYDMATNPQSGFVNTAPLIAGNRRRQVDRLGFREVARRTQAACTSTHFPVSTAFLARVKVDNAMCEGINSTVLPATPPQF